MTLPPPEDRPLPASVLDYERPVHASPQKPPALCPVAVLALATAILGGGGSLLLGRQFFSYRALNRLELLTPLIALVGIFLSVNALLRIAHHKNRLWGDPLAWTALVLNTILFLANGCCLSIRWVGNAN